jgi:hypothetical protein
MLSKCANPACSAEFLHLRNGRLFEIETECLGARQPEGKLQQPKRSFEYYWLCEDCVRLFALRSDGESVDAVALPGRCPRVVPIAEAGFDMCVDCRTCTVADDSTTSYTSAPRTRVFIRASRLNARRTSACMSHTQPRQLVSHEVR